MKDIIEVQKVNFIIYIYIYIYIYIVFIFSYKKP